LWECGPEHCSPTGGLKMKVGDLVKMGNYAGMIIEESHDELRVSWFERSGRERWERGIGAIGIDVSWVMRGHLKVISSSENRRHSKTN